MSSNILVIIPCYNEEKNITKVVEELRNDFSIADILIVNDYSTDNSLEIIKSLNVNYLNLPYNLGYSGALQTGFKYAVNNNYEYVIQFDGDGQHIASEAKKMLDLAIETKTDIIIGSRFKENTGYKHGAIKLLGTKIFRMLIRMLTKNDISDPTSGFQVLNRNVFERYSKILNFPEFPDSNLVIEMLLQGFTIKEVPVKMRLREFGVSMHSGILNPVKYMIKMFYSILMILINYGITTKKIKK